MCLWGFVGVSGWSLGGRGSWGVRGVSILLWGPLGILPGLAGRLRGSSGMPWECRGRSNYRQNILIRVVFEGPLEIIPGPGPRMEERRCPRTLRPTVDPDTMSTVFISV